MRGLSILAALAFVISTPLEAVAAEGSAVAGPIGGTDIRSAQLPPPGVYGGLIVTKGVAQGFYDGKGDLVPALEALDLTYYTGGPFLYFVPELQLFGGSIGIGGFLPVSSGCGKLYASTGNECEAGVADAYVELDWSRYFGTIRPSEYAGAFPIMEGLTVLVGVGALIPTGNYDARLATTQGIAIGNNIWDFAPTVAFTYVTEPILAEGTEFSAKLYWNNYLTNPDTHYSTGSLINVDFAVSEHIGRFQIGGAGLYVHQFEDDESFGIPVPPDGRRFNGLALGGVVAYDMPEFGASIKFKALASVISENAPQSYGLVLGWVKKF